ncbi:MAG: energy-coupling factor transporter transmembrane protein EcfT [Spirochaetaceae bacterium]|jgi:energy-coupling factor transport system permease protein|nr:energy-coupling factor transporter transmembrane protein EcfT [Spirochaetaceae bacterium]
MKRFMLGYIEGSSPLHRMNGAVKLIIFLLWSVLVMAGYDTRIMLVSSVMGLALFALSGIKPRGLSFILKMLAVFMALNLVCVYLFSPEEGVKIYGSRHLLARGAGRFTVTAEQLFYEFNIFLKYCQIVPLAIILLVTTHPSEFAASLNRAGVHYYIAFSVSLTMRYIPDVARDYTVISRSQEARGVELSRKAPFFRRLKGSAAILIPLIFSSLERINTISSAMELRGFGKHKKRTWYSARPPEKRDMAALITAILLFIFGMWFTFHDGDRFYNPFKS